LLFLFVVLAIWLVNAAVNNNRPIIGILTQRSDTCAKIGKGNSYIAASYVKYLESGGARVVPIFHNGNASYWKTMFDSINGVLFPGGDVSLDYSTYWEVGSFFYNQSIIAYQKGDIFPIVGHCLGFELLCILTSQDVHILSQRILDGVSIPLNLTSAYKTSRWLGKASSNLIDILSTKPVTLNNHNFGLAPQTYYSNSKLNSFYTVLATNFDKYGNEFISQFEANNYPIYGAQWHAEKPQFEWDSIEDINHSGDAIMAMQYFANYFVDQARLSQHKFANNQTEYNSLIFNYPAVYSEAFDPYFEQIYCFNQ